MSCSLVVLRHRLLGVGSVRHLGCASGLWLRLVSGFRWVAIVGIFTHVPPLSIIIVCGHDRVQLGLLAGSIGRSVVVCCLCARWGRQLVLRVGCVCVFRFSLCVVELCGHVCLAHFCVVRFVFVLRGIACVGWLCCRLCVCLRDGSVFCGRFRRGSGCPGGLCALRVGLCCARLVVVSWLGQWGVAGVCV